MVRNPLTIPLIALLRQHPAGCREYDLIKAIEADGGFPDLAQDYQLALFQKHFLVKNALYQLQQQLWTEEQLYLSIDALLIRLETPDLTANQATSTHDGSPLNNDGLSDKRLPDNGRDSALRSYYLDWQEYENATVESVDALLRNFWERYAGKTQQASALETLGLPEGASQADIRQQYRRLASQHHPDKGGCSARFIELRQAYETLYQRH